MNLYEIATAYVAAGLSVIPIRLDGSKQPDFALLPRAWDESERKEKATWNPYRERIASDAELRRWFGGRQPRGIALVAGPISGGAECLDLDDKGVAVEYLQALDREHPGLAEKVCWVDTPGGLHGWYRTDEIEGNTHLALRPPTEDELKANPKCRGVVLIETRAEGGYALVPGCPPECHPTRGEYRRVRGPKLTEMESLTAAEREALFALAAGFDRMPASPDPAPDPTPRPPGGGLRPGDDFDRRGWTWATILKQAGATFATGADDDGRVRRPGKDRGWSATVGYCRGPAGEPLLKVFTSNWPPFEPGKAYGKFRALALLRFRGDYAACARELTLHGFGDRGAHAPRSGGPKTGEAAPPGGGPGGSGTTSGHATPPPPEPWSPPIPLDDPDEEVPAFPLDALPRSVAEFVAGTADAVGCPPDYPGAFSLAVAAGAAGAAYALDVKDGYSESTSLYVAVIAPPSGGKTPALKAVAGPLYEEQARRHAAKEPVPAYVSDVTVEKLADLLHESPRGTLMLRDELAGWVNGMDQYKAKGSGFDRQFYLSCWAGDPVKVDRKNPDAPPLFIRHPCLSLAGGVQPEVLRKLRGSDDGFFDRILCTFPRPLPAKAEDWRVVDPALARLWAGIIASVRGYAMQPGENGPRPFFLKLSSDARGEWERWTGWLAAQINHPDFPPWLAGPAGKVKGYAARLALVLHVLRRAAGSAGSQLLGEDMARGAELARYFLAHARKVHRAMGRDPRVEEARRILRWLQGSLPPTFSRADAYRALRKTFARPEDLVGPLKLLQQLRYVRWAEPFYAGAGRRPAPAYETNPLLKNQAH